MKTSQQNKSNPMFYDKYGQHANHKIQKREQNNVPIARKRKKY